MWKCPYLLAEALAICGLLLSLFTHDTTGHVELESGGAERTQSLVKLATDVSFRDRTMSKLARPAWSITSTTAWPGRYYRFSSLRMDSGCARSGCWRQLTRPFGEPASSAPAGSATRSGVRP